MKMKVMIAMGAVLGGALVVWFWSRGSAPAHAQPDGSDEVTAAQEPRSGDEAMSAGAAKGQQVSRRISQVLGSRAGDPVKDVPAPVKPEGWDEIPSIAEWAILHKEMFDAYQLAYAKARVAGISKKVRECATKLPKDATVEWESASLFEMDGRGNAVVKRQRVLPADELDRDPVNSPFFECVKDSTVGMVVPLPGGKVPEGIGERFEIRDSHTTNAPMAWPIPADDLREMGEELAELRQRLSPEEQRESPSTPHALILARAREQRLSCIVEQKRKPSDCP